MLRIRLELRSIQSARERILQSLTAIAPSSEAKLLLDRPLKSIADDLGLTHECSYRTLAQLAKEGVIRRRKNAIEFDTCRAT